MRSKCLTKNGRMVKLIGGTLLTGIGLSGAMKGTVGRTIVAGFGISTMVEGLTGKSMRDMMDL